jgi:hypothetical protein
VEKTKSFTKDGQCRFAIWNVEGNLFHCMRRRNQFGKSMSEQGLGRFVVVVKGMAKESLR